ncbi:helix-turn-helix domain-containing protein [Luteimonas kalidii]|uniref:Helix-turn-helix domain-containing protein n=1 Tax=Luteimonas kalidii TaxID=3042025 RepID=A0ABT6JWI5_9GAMM|nr:helix-turn-helix domain-containing protein [Luteimonas kalidii]MDH5834853.1 helix-turn-helix domain-containing protein [Luteimonas kalidii]
MDSLIASAARALAAGDALGALKRVALREDPPALALRGIAMAQLGEYARARELLHRAARAFGPRETLARARCALADAEIALAMRDLSATPRSLHAAIAVLEAHGDVVNVAHAHLVIVRRSLLLGQLGAAHDALRRLDGAPLPASHAAIAGLAAAELSLRALRSGPARAALAQAAAAATRARNPLLLAEIEAAQARLAQPVARRLTATHRQPLALADVEALFASDALVVDGCRRGLRVGGAWLALARRPVLFALLQALAGAWPDDIARDAVIAAAFRLQHADDTHRARLRVELGRLRALVKPWAAIEATARGYRLVAHGAREVAVLLPPIEGEQAQLLALLSDGAAWSTTALALALGTSQRSVQRALAELEADGRAHARMRGRTRRWIAAPPPGFATTLLLPAVPAPA